MPPATHSPRPFTGRRTACPVQGTPSEKLHRAGHTGHSAMLTHADLRRCPKGLTEMERLRIWNRRRWRPVGRVSTSHAAPRVTRLPRRTRHGQRRTSSPRQVGHRGPPGRSVDAGRPGPMARLHVSCSIGRRHQRRPDWACASPAGCCCPRMSPSPANSSSCSP